MAGTFHSSLISHRITGPNCLLRLQIDRTRSNREGNNLIQALPGEIDYYCTTGIWQTVWLEPVPTIRIEEVRIVTHAKRNLLR